MNKNTRKTLLASMVGLFAAGGLSTAAAQETESARAQGVLDEIIVTSTRRAESLNDAALSVAAIGGEEISSRNLSEMNDYLRTVPGVTFVDQGVGRNSVVVRGLTLDPEREANSAGPTVGVYIGEVPLAGLSSLGGSADLKMVDLKRVEVLRGPQGTLFGSGSLGGAVRNVPNEPALGEFNGSLNATYSNTGGYGGGNSKIEGVLNMPVIEDELAIRVALYNHETSGYVKNVAGTQLATGGPIAVPYTAEEAVSGFGGEELYMNENEIGDASYTGGRISALWQLNDKFTATYSYITQDVEQDGIPYVQLNTGGYTKVELKAGDRVPGLGNEGLSDDIEISNLVLNYELDWGAIISSSSWMQDDSEFNYDASTFFGGQPVIGLIDNRAETFIEEIRFVSDFEGDFQLIAGVYYEDLQFDLSGSFLATGDLSVGGLANPLDSTDPLIHTDTVDKNIEQLSFYGEASYDITDQVEITVGARHFDYERTQTSVANGAFGVSEKNGNLEESGTNYKANLSYAPTDDALIYLQWSEGFRLGNVNFPIPKSLCDVNDDGVLDGTSAPIADGFDSDSTESFELGAKLTLLENKLQINAAAYRVDWQGIPLRVFAGKLPEQDERTCFFNTTYNAAEARSEGFELEASYQVSPDLSLFLGGAYTNTELAEDSDILGASRGDRLPSSPEYTTNLGVQYEFSVSNNQAFIRADYSYVSDFYNFIGENGVEAGDYGQININSNISFDNFNVGIFVSNLTDEDSLTSVGVQFPDTRAWRLRPRTAGINVGYEF